MDCGLNCHGSRAQRFHGKNSCFCLWANNHGFQPKAITREFFVGMLKIKKIMDCGLYCHGSRAQRFHGKNS